MKKKNIKHESYQDINSIKQYLQQIIDALDTGKVELSSGNDKILLKPHGLIGFSINANQSKAKQQIRLKLEWTPENVPLEQEDDELIIG